MNAGVLKRYVGTYKSDALRSEIVVSVFNKKLRFTATGNLRGRFDLKTVGVHTFEAEKVSPKLTLKFESKGDKAIMVSVSVGAQGPFSFNRK